MACFNCHWPTPLLWGPWPAHKQGPAPYFPREITLDPRSNTVSNQVSSPVLSHIPSSAVVLVGVGGAVVALFVFVVLLAILCFPLGLGLG
jgi:hypothetical protein